MTNPKSTASWRDSARPSKLWVFNSSATFPLLILLFHISYQTLFFAVAFTIALSLIDRMGYSLTVFGRVIRSTLAGKRRLATPWWLQ